MRTIIREQDQDLVGHYVEVESWDHGTLNEVRLDLMLLAETVLNLTKKDGIPRELVFQVGDF